MLKTETLQKIEKKYGFESMIRVARMESILHTKKPKTSDLNGLSSFGDRVEKSFAKLLGEDGDSAVKTMDLLMAAHHLEQCETLQGLGGCVVLEFEEYLSRAQEDRKESAKRKKERQENLLGFDQ